MTNILLNACRLLREGFVISEALNHNEWTLNPFPFINKEQAQGLLTLNFVSAALTREKIFLLAFQDKDPSCLLIF